MASRNYPGLFCTLTGSEAGYSNDDGESRIFKKWSDGERERRERKDVSDAIADELARRRSTAARFSGAASAKPAASSADDESTALSVSDAVKLLQYINK